MQLRLDPAKLDDAAIASIKDKVARSGIYRQFAGVRRQPHRSRSGQTREAATATPHPASNCAGKLGIPAIGGQSGTDARPCRSRSRWMRSSRSTPKSTSPLCEKNKVRMLWEPYAGGPNIATGPVGWEALFKAFKDSPHVGLQFDPSHLVWQFMDPVQAARDFADKIYDVHLKDTEILWHVVRRAASSRSTTSAGGASASRATARWIGKASSRCWRRSATPGRYEYRERGSSSTTRPTTPIGISPSSTSAAFKHGPRISEDHGAASLRVIVCENSGSDE